MSVIDLPNAPKVEFAALLRDDVAMPQTFRAWLRAQRESGEGTPAYRRWLMQRVEDGDD